MIWDNFSIFRRNRSRHPDDICPRRSTHMSWVSARMLSRCVVKWWKLRDSLAAFSQRWQGIGTRTLICSCMLWDTEKGEFSFQGRKQDFNSALWMFVWRVCKVFEGKSDACKKIICTVQRVHLRVHQCFQLPTNLDKDFFRGLFFVLKCRNYFHQRLKATNIMCFSLHSEILHCEK